MYILGLDCYYHDAAAALIKDGKLIAAAEEERFSRRKHDTDFPKQAIKFCLAYAGIDITEVDYVGFYEKPFIKFERLLDSFLATFPRSYNIFVKVIPSWLKQKLNVPSIIKKELGYKGQILFVDHHLSHAASAFLVSPFKEAAILTADAAGEWVTTSLGVAKDNNIILLKEIEFPHSLGLFYSAITAFLGFKVNNDEYKVMGPASYGNPSFYERFKKLIKILPDGSYKLNLDYFAYHYKMRMFSDKFIDEFGAPRIPESAIEQRHKDIASSAQLLLEDALLNAVNYLYEQTGKEALCIAGGVGLNCVANGKIFKQSPFKHIFIQPAAGDAGSAIGTAYFIYNSLLNNKREFVMEDVYLGPCYSCEEIRNFLVSQNIVFREFDYGDLIKITAKEIADDKIVGWFQGRMEFGPRALGNRSILANPRNPEMKDIINKRVKFREEFRPFAPAVLLEKEDEYFDLNYESPFMLLVANVKEEKKREIPAVTHIDGTARVQTVKREKSPLFYDLIREFYNLTGVPAVINTSFNVRGEPIVCSPREAYNCFLRTGMDCLVMDKFLISKPC